MKVNEWLTLGYANDFIELFNPNTLPVALGGLHLTDVPFSAPGRHPIAPLSFIAAQGFTEFVADNAPEQGANHVNFQLAAEQGQIALTAEDLTVIDQVAYGPQQPNVANGRCPDGGWNLVKLITPTPGSFNACPEQPPSPQTIYLIAMTNSWNYNMAGIDLGSEWRAAGYNDDTWLSGQPLFFDAPARTYTMPEPVRTTINVTNIYAIYFRAHFHVPAGTSPTALQLYHVVDDGAVIYINGNEVTRFNMAGTPGTPVNYTNLATSSVTDGAYVGPVTVAVTNIHGGDNVIAVELHQVNTNNADGTFGLRLEALVITNTPAQAGVVINEVLANNTSLAVGDGSTPDWIELYNPSSNTVNLADMSLSDTPANPRRWVFPPDTIVPAHGYWVVYCDADRPASTTNTGFGLRTTGEGIYLYNRPADGGLRDFILFGLQTPDYSIGRVPDGSSNWVLNTITPAAANVAALVGSVNNLRVNEWMAAPASGDDWFEIYNEGTLPVALGGLYLTDLLTDTKKYPAIHALSFLGVESNAFQKFVATGNTPTRADEVGFALKASGEAVGIATTNGILIDGTPFGAQASGVSQGRLPDGSANMVFFPATASPGEANYLPLAGVVINEVLAHTDPPLEDAIELRNLTATNVPLFDLGYATNTWRLRKGVDFDLPTNVILAPGGYLVIVGFNPHTDPASLTLFQTTYGSNATLLGPWSGKLDNAGEAIELQKPDAPELAPGPDFGHVPYLVVDRVVYDDQSPWSTNAGGLGASLQKIRFDLYGNEPTNWTAAAPQPGPNAGGDSDGDGMPDDWEIASGLDPHDPADAAGDADGDGMTNLQEYQAGTNPQDPGSVFKLSIRHPGTSSFIEIQFTVVAGHAYAVLFCPDLNPGTTWETITNIPAFDPPPATTNIVVTFPMRGSMGFFSANVRATQVLTLNVRESSNKAMAALLGVEGGAPMAVELKFTALVGQSYTIQHREALDRSEWQTLTKVPAQPSPFARQVIVTDLAPGTQRFYRLHRP